MKENDQRRILGEVGVEPSRRLGQNFLCDEEAARWIVDQLEPGPDDTVIEVGPGTGGLTEHLAGRVKRLVLAEKDPRLAAHVRERFAEAEVIEGDAVEMDLRPYYAGQPVKLIGNLPYSAAGEILRRLLSRPTPVSRAVITVQREVSERICAEPRSKRYGALTLRVQSNWEPKMVKVLGPEVFYPRPKVDSGVVLLMPRAEDALPPFDRALFDRLVRRGFSQRRKQLKKLIGEARERWAEVAAGLGISEKARAEELSLAQWVALTNALDPQRPPERDETGGDVFDVVDAEDRVTGQATRAEVHREGLRHRAVHVFLFNGRGELFLQKRSHLKDQHPRKWDSSAAGHLDAGEEYAVAAEREVKEELGVEPVGLEEVATIEACAETGWEFVHLYCGKVKGKMRLAPTEISDGEFFSLEMIREWMAGRPEDFAPGFSKCLEKYKSRHEAK